jgi:RHS repeat-associated protein
MKHISLFIICLFIEVASFSQINNYNYISTRNYIQAYAGDFLEVIHYYDELGRPIEKVQKAFTPQGKDLVSTTLYDGMGREWQNWLPAPSANTDGSFVDVENFKSSQISFHADTKPFSQTNFELSPGNRITGLTGAGQLWHSQQRKDSTIFSTNVSTEVKHFYVNSQGQLVINSYYPEASLYKTTTLDADGKPGTEFRDKSGRTVVKSSTSDVNTALVYNELNQLCYVLPPKAYDAFSGNTTIADSHDELKKYAYLYRYDSRGNCIAKRLPGCEWVYMVYDKANRMVLSQDGNMRNKPIEQWMITKYDGLGRVAVTGITSSLNNSSHQDLIQTYANDSVIETYANGVYTNSKFPDATPLILNYYDSYEFVSSHPALGYAAKSGYDTPHSSANGLLTGKRTYLLDGSGQYTVTALYYDYRALLVQSRSTNHLGGYDFTYNQYNFAGLLTQSHKEHSIPAQSTITELYVYQYDRAGRLITTNYKLNNTPAVIVAANTYDELGRITEKKRHDNTDSEEFEYTIRNWPKRIKSGTFEQKLYYNDELPQGAVPCYNGNIAYSTWTYDNQTRGYQYYYDALNRLTSAYYDLHDELFSYDKHGNIITLARMGNDGDMDNLQFDYTGNQINWIFDDAGSWNIYNLKEYTERNNSLVNPGVEFFYDDNGNLVTDYDRDIVTIRYNLLNLPDTIQFHNGNQIVHRYDASGRRLSTRYATIYFQLAQPLNQGEVVYGIDVCYEDNVTIAGNDYVGNIEYYTFRYFDYDLSEVPVESHLANKVYFDQGYIQGFRLVHSTPRYYYFRHDQLGNIREVWAAAYIRYGQTKPAATVQRIQYYPSGLPWKNNDTYSPIGQNRKYNGKEFVEMHGLNEYDSEARWYYPAIMRTTTMDPLAEKYYSISPYAWCGNNPVKFVDPDGRKIKFANNISAEFKSQFSTTVKFMRDKGTDGLISSIHKDKGTIYIAEGNGKSYFDRKTNTIYWDPGLGVLTTNGTIISPATVLNHEADHANQKLKNPEQLAKDVNTKDSQYKNAEEKRVITGSEQETAKKHGEIKENEETRTDHKGTMYETKTSTSTEGKYEVIVEP